MTDIVRHLKLLPAERGMSVKSGPARWTYMPDWGLSLLRLTHTMASVSTSSSSKVIQAKQAPLVSFFSSIGSVIRRPLLFRKGTSKGGRIRSVKFFSSKANSILLDRGISSISGWAPRPLHITYHGQLAV